MPGIFPDCCFPDNCECRDRGYEHERDSCAVPEVREAARLLGIDPDSMFDSHAHKRPQ